MRVLIAEDDPMARRLLERFLTQWGHEVVTAEDGAAAWRAFQQDDFPIVITDWLMPNVDGPELVRRIRSHPRPGYVYTILLTALTDKKDLVAGMEAGADDFLTKPFDRGELRARLGQGERVTRLERSLAEQNRALKEAQAALVQREQLASLGRLAAGVAHEINNPTAYVSNNLAVLRRDVLAAFDLLDAYRAARPTLEAAAPDVAADLTRREADADLDYIRETVPVLFAKALDGLHRVREIVRNLRDFARLDEAEFQEVDVDAAVTSTAEMLHHELKQRGVELRTDFGAPPRVLCHPGKVNQVFLNVLLNAAQACSPGGVVRVRTRAVPGDRVEVEVADDGHGIRPEHLPRVFDPFFTTKPVGQGTGLGLSVSYGIVRDHGGTIEAESEPGRGAVFRIRLPLRPPRPGARPTTPPGEEPR